MTLGVKLREVFLILRFLGIKMRAEDEVKFYQILGVLSKITGAGDGFGLEPARAVQ